MKLQNLLHKRGFDTTLISGPTNLDIDQEIKLIKVETADEMFKATQKNLPTDIAVFSAAVSDFKIDVKSKDKIKKKKDLNIKLERNVDILNYISNHNSMRPKLVIGFAAETKNLDSNAMKKLKNKNCDWIVANDVSKKILVLIVIITRLQFIIMILKKKKRHFHTKKNLKSQRRLLIELSLT